MRPCQRPAVPAAHGPRCRRAAPVLSAGLALLLLLSGCAWLDHQMHGSEVGIHTVSLHHFATALGDVAGKTQIVSDASDTRRFCIMRTPILSNRQIQGGELEDTGNPDRPALRLALDRQGSMLWLQACQEAPGDRVAVLLDGFFWYAMTLPRPTDTHSILIDGPIGRVEAQTIVDAIPGHYRRLNPRSGLF